MSVRGQRLKEPAAMDLAYARNADKHQITFAFVRGFHSTFYHPFLTRNTIIAILNIFQILDLSAF
jgi:hypothetical protein